MSMINRRSSSETNQQEAIPQGAGWDVFGVYRRTGELLQSGQRTMEQLQAFNEGRNPFSLNWYDPLVSRCRSQLASALKRPIIVPPPPGIITPELVKKLGSFGLSLAYFPNLDIHSGFEVKKGRWTRPKQWFYDNLGPDKENNPRIDPEATRIEPGWYAIDTTSSVDYADGLQVFPNDPLTSLITRLRQEKKIGGFDKTPIGSRFAITSDEWETIVAPALAQEIKLEPSQAVVRLERAVEFNLIGNVYDKLRGKFNCWEWFADLYGPARRLYGGIRDYGGLAAVYFSTRGFRDDYIAGRCLVKFLSESGNPVS